MALKEFQETYYPNGPSNVCLQGRRRYEFNERIYKTQSSEIYKAYDYVGQKMVAIKQIAPFDRSDFMFAVERVIYETQVQQSLGKKTPSVPGVRDFFVRQKEGNNVACIVMDVLKANNLFQTYYYNSNGVKVMGTAEILDFALQVLQVLGDMKKAGVLHGDIKPGNIAYSKDEGLKVFDFGLSKDLDDKGEFSPLNGCLYQSMFYRCPAAIIKSPMSSESDMWSLGCILFELFTSELLFYLSNDGRHDDMNTQYELFDLITRTLRQMPPQSTINKSNEWQHFLKPTRLNADGSKEVGLRYKVERGEEPETIRERMLSAIRNKQESTGGIERKITDEEEMLICVVEKLVSYDKPTTEQMMKYIAGTENAL
jgi:serine/threonine protein kinase